jgi:amino acid transporter
MKESVPKINSYFIAILPFLKSGNNFVIFRSYLPETVKTITSYIIIIIIIIIIILLLLLSSFHPSQFGTTFPLTPGFDGVRSFTVKCV